MTIEPISDNDMEVLNNITENIIGAGIEVHRWIGPGVSESVYADALAIEMNERKIRYDREVYIPVIYKGHAVGRYTLDFIVEGLVVVEVKSVERHNPLFDAQLMTYLRATKKRLGLLINFNSTLLRDGIHRKIL